MSEQVPTLGAVGQDGSVGEQTGGVQLWTGEQAPEPGTGRPVVTIGVFDGVHRGHQVVIGRAVALARAAGQACVVLTFDPHPATVLRPGSPVPTLASVQRRVALLGQAGADAVWVLPFTTGLSLLSPRSFVTDVLLAHLRPSVVVVGANFRFGHRASGDVTTLSELGAAHDFTVEAVELTGLPGLPLWSSTAVREHLATGDVDAAAAILGRPHQVDGVVVHGDHRGRGLGYPTANVAFAADTAVPADGVYSGWLVRDGSQRLPAAISVGTNPTFDGVGRRVEVYVLDRTDLDLYGEPVGAAFAHRLRATQRFESVADLLAAVAADVATARQQVG